MTKNDEQFTDELTEIETLLDTAFARLMKALQALENVLDKAEQFQQDMEVQRDALIKDMQAVHLAGKAAVQKYENLKQKRRS